MKLQPASRKEIKRIAIGTGILDLIMIAGLFLLSQFGIGSFTLLPILLGVLGGSAVAIANFTVLCITVQQAVEIEDKKQMKRRFQLSYNLRLILQAGWVVICLVVSQIHFFAGALPVLFPNLVIFYLQIRNKLVGPSENRTVIPPDEDEEDTLGTFEV